ncbi:MAG: hypothetical protein MJ192_03370 [Clostridia bacterium]|nr:hypothetical protein [Clostridia bacterium]
MKKNWPVLLVCTCLMAVICVICSCSQWINPGKQPDDNVYTPAPPTMPPEYVTAAAPDTEPATSEFDTVIEYKTDDNGEEYTEIVTVEPETNVGYEYIAVMQHIDHLEHGVQYDYIPEAEARAMTKLAMNFANTPLPVGGWVTPAPSLRDERNDTSGVLDAAYKKLARIGLTFVITQDEWSSPAWTLEALSSARRAGLKLWYTCGNEIDALTSVERVQAMLSSPDAEALAGVIVQVSPTESSLPDLAEKSKVIRRELGTANGLKIQSILPPPYATNIGYTGGYRSYLKSYASTCNPYIVAADYAPYQGKSGNTIPEMVASLLSLRSEAAATKFQTASGTSVTPPMYGVVQCSGSGTLREPTLYELRLNAHLALACGAKGIIYNSVCEQEFGNTTGVLDNKGETNEMYKMVSAVNAELEEMRGRCLTLTFKAMLVFNADDISKALTKMNLNENRTSWSMLSSVTVENNKPLLVSCFDSAAGSSGEGYYLVNPDVTESTTVTLSYKDPQALLVWSGKGLELVNWMKTLTVTLDPGEGLFIENTGLVYNDSTP